MYCAVIPSVCYSYAQLSDGINVATKMWINKSLAWYVYGFWIGYNHYVTVLLLLWNILGD